LIFDVPTLIETISAGITLYPGDIIATGTPVGVGIGFNPPKYLKAGDTVKIELSGIGVLENPVRQRGVAGDAKAKAEARA
jgi:2-keto-4-pentenoate hydratase/2-oxohepta-3-ene-1,7-dioic acid hydratase in catechol pathway